MSSKKVAYQPNLFYINIKSIANYYINLFFDKE